MAWQQIADKIYGFMIIKNLDLKYPVIKSCILFSELTNIWSLQDWETEECDEFELTVTQWAE